MTFAACLWRGVIHWTELNNDPPWSPLLFPLAELSLTQSRWCKGWEWPGSELDVIALHVCGAAGEADVCHYCPLLKYQHFLLTKHSLLAAIKHRLLLFQWPLRCVISWISSCWWILFQLLGMIGHFFATKWMETSGLGRVTKNQLCLTRVSPCFTLICWLWGQPGLQAQAAKKSQALHLPCFAQDNFTSCGVKCFTEMFLMSLHWCQCCFTH